MSKELLSEKELLDAICTKYKIHQDEVKHDCLEVALSNINKHSSYCDKSLHKNDIINIGILFYIYAELDKHLTVHSIFR